MTICLFKEKN
uniref:Uncharacterized protein n=1 Tax=Rhizophora mucronata TaxID=61149 RepID=A0A2P2QF98_RHIMU